jgi:enolase-phosphatase E1
VQLVIKAILLDIEGTTTPIDFVYKVLFPFARQHCHRFLTAHFSEQSTKNDVSGFVDENARDTANGLNPPPLEPNSKLDPAIVTQYVHWLMDQDRKSTPLKSLQGRIWQEGYEQGELRGQVFDDVPPAFNRWRSLGKRIYIYSSGSVLAQKLLFGNTECGDLMPMIDGYFDTNVGAKGEAGSYRQIAKTISMPASEILFISDVTAELAAARAAGFQVLLCNRPGNKPQPDAAEYKGITSFDAVAEKREKSG